MKHKCPRCRQVRDMLWNEKKNWWACTGCQAAYTQTVLDLVQSDFTIKASPSWVKVNAPGCKSTYETFNLYVDNTYTSTNSVPIFTPGTIYADDFPGATPEERLKAALAYASAQTYPPTVVSPSGKVTIPPKEHEPPRDTYREKAASEFDGVEPLDESLWGAGDGGLL